MAMAIELWQSSRGCSTSPAAIGEGQCGGAALRQARALVHLMMMSICVAVFAAPRPTQAAECERGACGCPEAAATEGVTAPSDLTITYYGVSTLMFSDGENRLLVDGFFSRPNLPRLLFLPIDADPRKVANGLGEQQAPVLAVLTAHAHHDHALDVAAVAAKERRAVVVGTRSVARLAQARKVSDDRVCVPFDGEAMTFGPYKVTAHDVPHGPSVFFLRWILDHRLTRKLSGAAWFGSYKDDENLSYLVEYGGRKVLVHPSASKPTTPIEAEIVFLGLGRVGRMSESESRGYWDAVVQSQTTAVVPIHWDRFTTDLGEPLLDSPKLLDDVGEARKRVCAYAMERSGLSMIRLDAKGVLAVPVGLPPRGTADAGSFCDPTGGEAQSYLANR